jgi:probable rRNA maturation factor
MNLNFINECNLRFSKELFLEVLKKATQLLEIPEKEVELVLVNDAEMQRINSETRGKNVPTDVLSFANREIEEESMRDSNSLGQIFISVETAAKNAAEMNQSLEEEMQFLFVHGVLHCVGYDHQNPEEEEKMKEMAYKILGRN